MQKQSTAAFPPQTLEKTFFSNLSGTTRLLFMHFLAEHNKPTQNELRVLCAVSKKTKEIVHEFFIHMISNTSTALDRLYCVRRAEQNIGLSQLKELITKSDPIEEASIPNQDYTTLYPLLKPQLLLTAHLEKPTFSLLANPQLISDIASAWAESSSPKKDKMALLLCIAINYNITYEQSRIIQRWMSYFCQHMTLPDVLSYISNLQEYFTPKHPDDKIGFKNTEISIDCIIMMMQFEIAYNLAPKQQRKKQKTSDEPTLTDMIERIEDESNPIDLKAAANRNLVSVYFHHRNQAFLLLNNPSSQEKSRKAALSLLFWWFEGLGLTTRPTNDIETFTLLCKLNCTLVGKMGCRVQPNYYLSSSLTPVNECKTRFQEMSTDMRECIDSVKAIIPLHKQYWLPRLQKHMYRTGKHWGPLLNHFRIRATTAGILFLFSMFMFTAAFQSNPSNRMNDSFGKFLYAFYDYFEKPLFSISTIWVIPLAIYILCVSALYGLVHFVSRGIYSRALSFNSTISLLEKILHSVSDAEACPNQPEGLLNADGYESKQIDNSEHNVCYESKHNDLTEPLLKATQPNGYQLV